MTAKKLKKISGEDRRNKIIMAALPLFAEHGIKATTTKAIAKAASVSEALLYQHFESKEKLFEAIGEFICTKHDRVLQKIKELEPSTVTLIHITYFLVAGLTLEDDYLQSFKEMVQQIIIDSCMTDGKFAKFFLNDRMKQLIPVLIKSIKKAEEAGDMTVLTNAQNSAINRVWFSHHLALALAMMKKNSVIEYQYPDELVNQTVAFLLRGIGLKDSVIKAQFHPQTLSIMVNTLKREVTDLW